ncbi:hypothetical protein F3Y22_tig00112636pilonHSYRG00008 [Hibiscus syriacus]|uniref:Peptidase metallopeptidase domain-containing protein n=1 Tax=Hibiscus syriacus TaxID=106335 RepID=A0A6A2WUR0_HIBSY|nr:hypothetical protein F3Y22_tig00112636pilonHSYRG00008 [Hibiscus syriacus]
MVGENGPCWSNPCVLGVASFAAKSATLKLESLQNLEHAQKGDVVNGVHQVKKFLKAFGYYPREINRLDDHFDDALEAGLTVFQQLYHLNVTALLDSNTIKAMATPRCGVPDVNINKTSNGGSNHRVFRIIADYSFFPGNPRWSRYQLTYSFLSDSVPVVSLQVLGPIIARAFQTWANVSPFRFRQVAQGTRSDIRIGFYRRSHGDGAPFDGPGGVLAHAFSPQDGRFHYDAEENWSSNPSGSQVDLESVAVHEIGHVLGLGHSQDRSAIMFPSFQVGTTKRNLGQDDINGLRALYRY